MKLWVRALGCVVGALAIGGGVVAADWTGFMGPMGRGVSKEKIAHAWPASGPKELWKVDVGSGFGGAAIVEGKVYFLDRQEDAKDKLRVFDLQTGKEEWGFEYQTGNYKGGYPGNRSTPAVDGGVVYTVGVLGQVNAIDIKTQKPIWSKNIVSDYGAQPGGWGFAMSAVVLRDMVIIDTPGSS